ncbi:FBLN2 [Branchiostoma lanceolatum]|uniref:FBLN2 protein n=1 Tax=Branchiostoma lanceolatum TaxID=7740 RepID=A0A8J9ZNU9_BRALA|nr:FBLN2 [Branchiostoma lanceolatum]
MWRLWVFVAMAGALALVDCRTCTWEGQEVPPNTLLTKLDDCTQCICPKEGGQVLCYHPVSWDKFDEKCDPLPENCVNYTTSAPDCCPSCSMIGCRQGEDIYPAGYTFSRAGLAECKCPIDGGDLVCKKLHTARSLGGFFNSGRTLTAHRNVQTALQPQSDSPADDDDVQSDAPAAGGMQSDSARYAATYRAGYHYRKMHLQVPPAASTRGCVHGGITYQLGVEFRRRKDPCIQCHCPYTGGDLICISVTDVPGCPPSYSHHAPAQRQSYSYQKYHVNPRGPSNPSGCVHAGTTYRPGAEFRVEYEPCIQCHCPYTGGELICVRVTDVPECGYGRRRRDTDSTLRNLFLKNV